MQRHRQLWLSLCSCKDKNLLSVLEQLEETAKQRLQLLCWIRAGLERGEVTPDKLRPAKPRRGQKECQKVRMRLHLNTTDGWDVLAEWDQTPRRGKDTYFAGLIRTGWEIVGANLVGKYLRPLVATQRAPAVKTEEQIFMPRPHESPVEELDEMMSAFENWGVLEE